MFERQIEEAIVELLPLPENLAEPFGMAIHSDELLSWFHQNHDRLVWDEERQKFVLQEVN